MNKNSQRSSDLLKEAIRIGHTLKDVRWDDMTPDDGAVLKDIITMILTVARTKFSRGEISTMLDFILNGIDLTYPPRRAVFRIDAE